MSLVVGCTGISKDGFAATPLAPLIGLPKVKRSTYTGKLWQMSWMWVVAVVTNERKCCSSAMGVDSHEVVQKLKLGWFCEREFVHVCTSHMLSSDAGGSSVVGQAVRARWKDHGTYTQAGGPIGLGSWVLGQNWALCEMYFSVLQCRGGTDCIKAHKLLDDRPRYHLVILAGGLAGTRWLF